MSTNLTSSKISSSAKKIKNTPPILLAPLIFVLAFLPLIVKLYNYETHLSEYSWFSANDQGLDFFLYYKSVFFIAVSAFFAACVIYKLITEKKQIKYTPILIPIGVYALFAFFSSILSEHKYFSFHGLFEQFESVWVLLGYCVALYYAYLFINTEHDLHFVINWFLVGILILGFLGLTQALGYDFFSTSLGKALILPKQYIEQELTFTFDKGRVYLSLYNPNYVGLYASMVIPILIVLLLFSKKLFFSIIYIIAALLMLVSMFGAQAKNGVVALLITLLFIALLFHKPLLKKWKWSLLGIVLMIVTFFGINAYNNNIFFDALKNAFRVTKTAAPTLRDIATKDEEVVVYYNEHELHVKQREVEPNVLYDFELTDQTGTIVSSYLNPETNQYIIEDTRFATIQVYNVLIDETSLGFCIAIDGLPWYFMYKNDSYYYVNPYGKLDKIQSAPSAVFTDYPELASRRGYIWSRTIPLLKDHLILGAGADAFTFVYPHQDYIGRYHMGFLNEIMTKPHNLYLQIGIQTGVISLLAFLIFYAMYFFSSMKLYFKQTFDTYMAQVGAAIFIGTIGYMVSGIVNDSSISVSPIFWVLTGIGLACNKQVQSTYNRHTAHR